MVDALLPPRCLSCNVVVGQGGGLCGQCWSATEFITAPYCARLGTPFPFDPGEDVESPAAIANPPNFDRARAVARFDGPARDLIHALKYRDRLEAADTLAAFMRRAAAELIVGCDLVIPVPLHSGRLFSRRFNQAALLAERIARTAECRYEPAALVRVKPTRQQTGLSARQRQRNLTGAFKIAPAARGKLSGRRVLLVDDVLTTGATVNACARVCREAGATGVDVAVFARVVSGENTAILGANHSP